MTAQARLRPLSHEEARCFTWMDEAPARKIIAALDAARLGASRFVGGCVRDSLLGEKPKDFDIATTLLPQDVIRALNAAALGAAPTGVDHGTITGIADRTGVEITTLRADVATDGRRATVAFTEDWDLDARRRDFRLNAIYLTTDRKLFDPVGGVEDARARRVRFIGEADDRIREDYLRILRFFRFSARFAKDFDAAGLAACARLKDGIAQLSAERVGDELLKILALPCAAAAIDAMNAASILTAVWSDAGDVAAFAALKDLARDAPPALGLAALWGEAAGLDAALRLSNADARRRIAAHAGAEKIHAKLTDKDARALFYRLGEDVWRDALLLARARANDSPALGALAAAFKGWTAPAFPIAGRDVIAAGIAKGPAVSRILNAVENVWIAEDFPPADRAKEILRQEIARAAP